VRPWWLAPVLTVGVVGSLVAILAVAALSVGTPSLDAARLLEVLRGGDVARLERIVVWELRLPRLLLALAGGAALSLAGALLQASLRNPLAGPELIGVSAGASVVMAAIVILHIPLAFALYP